MPRSPLLSCLFLQPSSGSALKVATLRITRVVGSLMIWLTCEWLCLCDFPPAFAWVGCYAMSRCAVSVVAFTCLRMVQDTYKSNPTMRK